jgi:hypothetical protein
MELKVVESIAIVEERHDNERFIIQDVGAQEL